MDKQIHEMLELAKTIPSINSELNDLKTSISEIERDMEGLSKSINSLNVSTERIDGHIGDVTSLKYSVQSMQDSMRDLLGRVKDISDKYRDIMDAIKNSERTWSDKHYNMMRTIYDIENNVKENLNRQESNEAAIHSVTNAVDNLSKRGTAVEKAAANPAAQETMFERIVKVAPNYIAIITFLGYIIYTLIEHKLMGKM